MSRFSDEEREQILAESRRLIEDGIDADERSMYEPRGDERSEALAEALAEPVEDAMTKWRRQADEQDEQIAQARAERKRIEAERKREAAPAPVPAPVDWGVVDQLIHAAVAVERERVGEILAHLIAGLRAEAADDLERATEILREEFKLAIAKAAAAGDCVVRGSDGAIDTFASERKNRTQFRNTMRRARAAASASEGMTIDLNASDGLNFGSPKRSVN
jgi:hypothetical protein